jgi:hypothetical protein
MSQPVPMSREEMRNLKAETDEKARMAKVNTIVRNIYGYATRQAMSCVTTSYEHLLPQSQTVSCQQATKRALATKNMTKKEEQFEQQSAMFAAAVTTTNICEFHAKNMADILRLLQELFPGCIVMNKQLVMGQDGKMYDMALMDEKVLPFVNQSQSKEYIVIDWS